MEKDRFCGVFHRFNINSRYTYESVSSTDTLTMTWVKGRMVWIE
ncbi:hypothetical protein IMSAGC005_01526 [Lachnospiraceae bacterium]|nr:hypothetical protein IMSAGC005_01526 [Lachnospiraceae bacterium]